MNAALFFAHDSLFGIALIGAQAGEAESIAKLNRNGMRLTEKSVGATAKSSELAGMPVLLRDVSHSPASNLDNRKAEVHANSWSRSMQRIAALRELRLRSSYSVFKC